MTYTIEITENPAGYSEGTYGYIIWEGPKDDGNCSCDGGYASRELAQEAAEAQLARIET